MFSHTKLNLGPLEIREGMRVADFGAGRGYYAMAASELVGNFGKVYAIEVQKELVKHLEAELKDKSIKNVECIWGDVETLHGSKLADQSIDRLIMTNILFQVGDKLGLVDEAKRILKKGGKVLVIDWRDKYGGIGPSHQHLVKYETTEELFTKRGFKKVEDVNVSAHQYGIIFVHE